MSQSIAEPNPDEMFAAREGEKIEESKYSGEGIQPAFPDVPVNERALNPIEDETAGTTDFAPGNYVPDDEEPVSIFHYVPDPAEHVKVFTDGVDEVLKPEDVLTAPKHG